VSSYKVRCEWDDGTWLVTTLPVASVVRVHCRRLDQVEARVSRAVHDMTGEPVGQISVEIGELVGVAELRGGRWDTDANDPAPGAADLRLPAPPPLPVPSRRRPSISFG
jgi:hypothetical protein